MSGEETPLSDEEREALLAQAQQAIDLIATQISLAAPEFLDDRDRAAKICTWLMQSQPMMARALTDLQSLQTENPVLRVQVGKVGALDHEKRFQMDLPIAYPHEGTLHDKFLYAATLTFLAIPLGRGLLMHHGIEVDVSRPPKSVLVKPTILS